MTYRELLADCVKAMTPSALELSDKEYEKRKKALILSMNNIGNEDLKLFVKALFEILDQKRLDSKT